MERGKYLIIVLLILSLNSCNKKTSVKNTEIAKEQTIDEQIMKEQKSNGLISVNEDMDKYEQILKSYGFKFPNDELYAQRLKEVFDLDLKDYTGKDFIEIKTRLLSSDESDRFPEAVVKKNFLFWYPQYEWDDLAFVNLNKYIFYNDKAAFTYLKSKNDNCYLTYLVQYFGYDKDSELLDYIFKRTKGELNNSYALYLFLGRNGVKGKMELRKDLFDKYFKEYPEADIYESKFIEYINGNDKYEGDKNSDIAYLLNKMVLQCRFHEYLECGAVDAYLDANRDFREDLRKNKFYGYEKLREYIQYSYEIDYLNQTRKIIKDPDGYTNLRADKNANSKVIEKIKTGTYVEVIDDTGDWWYIEVIEYKKDHLIYKQGYVHKSRIVNE